MICLTPDEEIRFQQKPARDGIDEVEELFRHIDLRNRMLGNQKTSSTFMTLFYGRQATRS